MYRQSPAKSTETDMEAGGRFHENALGGDSSDCFSLSALCHSLTSCLDVSWSWTAGAPPGLPWALEQGCTLSAGEEKAGGSLDRSERGGAARTASDPPAWWKKNKLLSRSNHHHSGFCYLKLNTIPKWQGLRIWWQMKSLCAHLHFRMACSLCINVLICKMRTIGIPFPKGCSDN